MECRRGNSKGGMVIATTASAKRDDSCHNCRHRQMGRFYEKSDKPSFVVSIAVNCLEERVERGVALFLFFLLVCLRFLAERFPLVMFGSILGPCGRRVNRGLLVYTFDWPSRRSACARRALSLSVHRWKLSDHQSAWVSSIQANVQRANEHLAPSTIQTCKVQTRCANQKKKLKRAMTRGHVATRDMTIR
jgi:hypothetical protein